MLSEQEDEKEQQKTKFWQKRRLSNRVHNNFHVSNKKEFKLNDQVMKVISKCNELHKSEQNLKQNMEDYFEEH